MDRDGLLHRPGTGEAHAGRALSERDRPVALPLARGGAHAPDDRFLAVQGFHAHRPRAVLDRYGRAGAVQSCRAMVRGQGSDCAALRACPVGRSGVFGPSQHHRRRRAAEDAHVSPGRIQDLPDGTSRTDIPHPVLRLLSLPADGRGRAGRQPDHLRDPSIHDRPRGGREPGGGAGVVRSLGRSGGRDGRVETAGRSTQSRSLWGNLSTLAAGGGYSP